VAELVEVKEADDVAPRGEVDVRPTEAAEVDDLVEWPERLGHLDDDLGRIPVGEGLQVRRAAVAEGLHGDSIAGRGRQAAQNLPDLPSRVSAQGGTDGHGTERATGAWYGSHSSTVRSRLSQPNVGARLAKNGLFPLHSDRRRSSENE
jgi:hypothetical protein